MSILPLFLATFRYNVGYDYGSYITAFYNYGRTSIDTILKEYRPGAPIAYQLLTKLSTIFGSERFFLFILAFVSLIPALTYILREWKDYETQPLIIFFYLFSPFMFGFSAIKQGIALSILVFSLTYVYRKRPVGFIICVTCAMLFHSTALAFAPVYFFVNHESRIGLYKRICIVVACLLLIYNLQYVLENVFGGIYEDYATNIVEGRNRSFWLYGAMTILFVSFRKRLIEIDERNELLIMLMVVGALCQLLGFRNAFAKRIGEYFIFSQVFLLPQLCYVVPENSKRIVKAIIVIYIVTIFLVANPVASSGMGFVPYYFKFS